MTSPGDERRNVTLSSVEPETPWIPCPSIDVNAAAVPLTRNGRSHSSTKAPLKCGAPVPQALRSPLR